MTKPIQKEPGFASTPEPPYYAVIFTTVDNSLDEEYSKTAQRMEELALEQDGFLGIESARSDVGITVSYWKDLESIKKWKMHADHSEARERGRKSWYKSYVLRISKVEKEYSWNCEM